MIFLSRPQLSVKAIHVHDDDNALAKNRWPATPRAGAASDFCLRGNTS